MIFFDGLLSAQIAYNLCNDDYSVTAADPDTGVTVLGVTLSNLRTTLVPQTQLDGSVHLVTFLAGTMSFEGFTATAIWIGGNELNILTIDLLYLLSITFF